MKTFLCSGTGESLSDWELEESSLDMTVKPLIETKTAMTETICTAKYTEA